MSSGETTTFRVETEYVASDHASVHLKHIEEQAEKTAEAVEGLKEGLKMAAEAIGLKELATEAVKTFIGFNSTIEQTKLHLTSMVGSQFKANWKQASNVAGEMFEKFEKFAETAPVTAEEMSNLAKSLGASVTQAGGGIEDITKLAEKGAVAAKALGFETERASSDIMRMLSGHVSERSPMAQMLLGATGMSQAQWKGASRKTRLTKLEGALDSDTVKDATGALRNSFGGAVAMFKDKIEVAMGKVGLPLFQAVSKEVKSWNEWIEANPKKIAEITGAMTDGLKEAMNVVRDVGATLFPIIREVMSVVGDVMHFVSEHRDVIEGVVKGLLIYKGLSLAGGAAGGAGGMLGGLMKSMSGMGKMFGEVGEGLKGMREAFGGGTVDLGGLLKGFGGALAPLIGSAGTIALFGTALYGLAKVMFGETESEKAAKEHSVMVGMTAAKWNKDSAERNSLLAQQKGNADILAANPEYHGINKRLKELAGTKEDILQMAVNEGLVTRTVSGDTARYTRTAGQGGMLANTEDEKAIIKALSDVMAGSVDDIVRQRDAYRSGSGAPFYQEGQWDPHNAAGFFEDKIKTADSEKIEEQLQAKSPPILQNINVTIQQVSAKDPDRWLADIDDMVGHQLNRRRSPLKSIGSKAGSGR